MSKCIVDVGQIAIAMISGGFRNVCGNCMARLGAEGPLFWWAPEPDSVVLLETKPDGFHVEVQTKGTSDVWVTDLGAAPTVDLHLGTSRYSQPAFGVAH